MMWRGKGMSKKIPLQEKILSANDQLALEIRKQFDAAGLLALNLVASPGAGKTSLIEHTIRNLGEDNKLAVIDGDLATSIDADRAAAAGAASVQINTGGQCHLDANMLQAALPELNLPEIDLLIVENVGNLVCPASFQLGTHKTVLVASVPEGDDKPYKYPVMYRGVDALVVNKVDLLPYVEFDMGYFQRGVELLNPGLKSFVVSCRTGEGLEDWFAWVRDEIDALRREA
jgi:hydrogenase nickel incorporation protein HypB